MKPIANAFADKMSWSLINLIPQYKQRYFMQIVVSNGAVFTYADFLRYYDLFDKVNNG